MVNRRYTWLGGLVTGALLLGLTPLGLLHAAPGRNTLVLVTQKNSALSELSLRELKRLYKAEQVTGPDGKALIPLHHAIGSPTRVAFESLVLKMSQDEIGRFWIDRKIRGQIGMPKSVPVVAVLRKAVALLPGTLTYLDVNDLTPDLKVLAQYTTDPYTSDAQALVLAGNVHPSQRVALHAEHGYVFIESRPGGALGNLERWGRQVARSF